MTRLAAPIGVPYEQNRQTISFSSFYCFILCNTVDLQTKIMGNSECFFDSQAYQRLQVMEVGSLLLKPSSANTREGCKSTPKPSRCYVKAQTVPSHLRIPQRLNLPNRFPYPFLLQLSFPAPSSLRQRRMGRRHR